MVEHPARCMDQSNAKDRKNNNRCVIVCVIGAYVIDALFGYMLGFWLEHACLLTSTKTSPSYSYPRYQVCRDICIALQNTQYNVVVERFNLRLKYLVRNAQLGFNVQHRVTRCVCMTSNQFTCERVCISFLSCPQRVSLQCTYRVSAVYVQIGVSTSVLVGTYRWHKFISYEDRLYICPIRRRQNGRQLGTYSHHPRDVLTPPSHDLLQMILNKHRAIRYPSPISQESMNQMINPQRQKKRHAGELTNACKLTMSEWQK